MRIKEKLIGLRLIYVTVCHRKTFRRVIYVGAVVGTLIS